MLTLKGDLMEEFRFPFPGRELADKELTYDPCYGKIAEADRAVIVEKAWQKAAGQPKWYFPEQTVASISIPSLAAAV